MFCRFHAIRVENKQAVSFDAPRQRILPIRLSESTLLVKVLSYLFLPNRVFRKEKKFVSFFSFFSSTLKL